MQFTKNAESKYGVLNGYTGTVRAVERRRVDVELDGGRMLSVDPVKYPHLEWAWACTTHKSQGQGTPLAIVSLTAQDTARSAHVALTRCETGLRVHTRLKPEDPERKPSGRGEELLEHLCSPAALRPKDDALLFEEQVRRTGGPHTPWARAVRRGLEHDADPLRQEHRAEMHRRSEARAAAIVEVLVRYREQRDRASTLDEPQLKKKIAQLDAGERRELEAVYDRHAPESFVSWAVRRRDEVVRQAPFLELQADREEQHRVQRLAHDVAHEIAPAVRQELERRDQERVVDEDRQERRGIRR